VFVSEADLAGRGAIALFQLEQTENFLKEFLGRTKTGKNIAIPAC